MNHSSFPEMDAIPARSFCNSTLLPTSINIFEPLVTHAFLLINTLSSGVIKPIFMASYAKYKVRILARLAGAIFF